MDDSRHEMKSYPLNHLPFMSKNIYQLHDQYWFHDGAVKSFHLDVRNSRAEIELLVSRIRKGYSSPLRKEDLLPCTLQMVFEHLIEVSLFDRFPTQGIWIDFSANKNMADQIEVCLNIHDHSSYVYEKPNWVIRAKQINWKEV